MQASGVLELDFGLGGNGSSCCGEGWLAPEVGHRWSFGVLSSLHFRDLPRKAAYALIVTAVPFGGPQRIGFVANGKSICETLVLGLETFGCMIPGEIVSAGGELRIDLQQPDARRIRDVLRMPDDRLLGFAVARMTVVPVDWQAAREPAAHDPGSLPVRELMLGFENLGDNCEFGIVQRRCGAEPLGLLRFSATQLRPLAAGVRDSFAGMTEPDNLRLAPYDTGAKGAKEYLLYQTKYELIYHTFVFEGQMNLDVLFARERRKLAFLHAKFLEDLADSRKIFVVKRNIPMAESDVVPLWHALRSHGPNTLLWVVPADAAHPGGTVEVRCDGLLKGYIDRFAPYDDATNVSVECWIALCRNAVGAARRLPSSAGAAGQAAAAADGGWLPSSSDAAQALG